MLKLVWRIFKLFNWDKVSQLEVGVKSYHKNVIKISPLQNYNPKLKLINLNKGS